MGWATLKNGALLSLAEKTFDVFITVDRNLSTQQNLSRFDIAVMVLRSKSNRLEDLKTLVPKALSALPRIKPKQITTINL